MRLRKWAQAPPARSPYETNHRRRCSSRAILLAATVLLAGAASPQRFATPLQPWRNADRTVALLRPLLAAPQTTAPALDALMTPGWRLVWNGIPSAGPGQVVVRLQLAASPVPPETGATEVLQVGTSRDPDIVPQCLHDGIAAKHVERLPDRRLGGVRFLAWRNADAGTAQTITATDLRAVVDGTCYAVERFRTATSAAPAPPPGTPRRPPPCSTPRSRASAWPPRRAACHARPHSICPQARSRGEVRRALLQHVT